MEVRPRVKCIKLGPFEISVTFFIFIIGNTLFWFCLYESCFACSRKLPSKCCICALDVCLFELFQYVHKNCAVTTSFHTCFILPRSMSPNLSNRSSPLTFNVVNHTSGTDCPDPFANGADIQISNIDYRLSRKELQQTLQETFSRHGKVKGKIPSINFFLYTSCLYLCLWSGFKWAGLRSYQKETSTQYFLTKFAYSQTKNPWTSQWKKTIQVEAVCGDATCVVCRWWYSAIFFHAEDGTSWSTMALPCARVIMCYCLRCHVDLGLSYFLPFPLSFFLVKVRLIHLSAWLKLIFKGKCWRLCVFSLSGKMCWAQSSYRLPVEGYSANGKSARSN